MRELDEGLLNHVQHFSNLFELDLSENAGFDLVEISKHIARFKHLTTLHLSGSMSLIGFPIIDTLTHITDTRPMLRRLDLSGSADGDWQATVVAQCPMFAGLKFLNMSDSNLTSAGLQALANSFFLRELEVLLAPRNNIKMLPTSTSSPLAAGLASLKFLDVRYNACKT